MNPARFRRSAHLAALALLAALPLLPVPEFWITQLNYIGLYTLVVIGLVLLTGVVGLTSFGQAAFVGLGAYATAWISLSPEAAQWLGHCPRAPTPGSGCCWDWW